MLSSLRTKVQDRHRAKTCATEPLDVTPKPRLPSPSELHMKLHAWVDVNSNSSSSAEEERGYDEYRTPNAQRVTCHKKDKKKDNGWAGHGMCSSNNNNKRSQQHQQARTASNTPVKPLSVHANGPIRHRSAILLAPSFSCESTPPRKQETNTVSEKAAQQQQQKKKRCSPSRQDMKVTVTAVDVGHMAGSHHCNGMHYRKEGKTMAAEAMSCPHYGSNAYNVNPSAATHLFADNDDLPFRTDFDAYGNVVIVDARYNAEVVMPYYSPREDIWDAKTAQKYEGLLPQRRLCPQAAALHMAEVNTTTTNALRERPCNSNSNSGSMSSRTVLCPARPLFAPSPLHHTTRITSAEAEAEPKAVTNDSMTKEEEMSLHTGLETCNSICFSGNDVSSDFRSPSPQYPGKSPRRMMSPGTQNTTCMEDCSPPPVRQGTVAPSDDLRLQEKYTGEQRNTKEMKDNKKKKAEKDMMHETAEERHVRLMRAKARKAPFVPCELSSSSATLLMTSFLSVSGSMQHKAEDDDEEDETRKRQLTVLQHDNHSSSNDDNKENMSHSVAATTPAQVQAQYGAGGIGIVRSHAASLAASLGATSTRSQEWPCMGLALNSKFDHSIYSLASSARLSMIATQTARELAQSPSLSTSAAAAAVVTPVTTHTQDTDQATQAKSETAAPVSAACTQHTPISYVPSTVTRCTTVPSTTTTTSSNQNNSESCDSAQQTKTRVKSAPRMDTAPYVVQPPLTVTTQQQHTSEANITSQVTTVAVKQKTKSPPGEGNEVNKTTCATRPAAHVLTRPSVRDIVRRAQATRDAVGAMMTTPRGNNDTQDCVEEKEKTQREHRTEEGGACLWGCYNAGLMTCSRKDAQVRPDGVSEVTVSSQVINQLLAQQQQVQEVHGLGVAASCTSSSGVVTAASSTSSFLMCAEAARDELQPQLCNSNNNNTTSLITNMLRMRNGGNVRCIRTPQPPASIRVPARPYVTQSGTNVPTAQPQRSVENVDAVCGVALRPRKLAPLPR